MAVTVRPSLTVSPIKPSKADNGVLTFNGWWSLTVWLIHCPQRSPFIFATSAACVGGTSQRCDRRGSATRCVLYIYAQVGRLPSLDGGAPQLCVQFRRVHCRSLTPGRKRGLPGRRRHRGHAVLCVRPPPGNRPVGPVRRAALGRRHRSRVEVAPPPPR